MICQPCGEMDHAHCIDIYWGPTLETGHHSPDVVQRVDGSTDLVGVTYYHKPGRAYRSCDCQHRWSSSSSAVTPVAPAEELSS